MAKKTILVPVTSRAAYGRLKSVIKHMQKSEKLEPYVILACSALLEKYGDLRSTLLADDILYRKELNPVFAGDTHRDMVKTQGEFTKQIADVLYEVCPDAVLVHADRYEMLSVAIAAKFMGIKIIHTQGGEISGCIDDDVRNMITLIADYHFPATEDAARRIRDMRPDLSASIGERVVPVGCPSIDLIANQDLTITENLNYKYAGVGKNVDFSKDFALVLINPDTKADKYIQSDLVDAAMAAIKTLCLPAVWIWGNIDSGSDIISKDIRRYRELGMLDNVKFFKNLAPEDYYKTMNACKCIVGNSSSGIREASFLQKPFICIGNRQKGRASNSNVIFADAGKLIKSKHDICQSLDECMLNIKYSEDEKTYYGDGNAAARIVKAMETIYL